MSWSDGDHSLIAGNGTVELNEFTAMMSIFLERRKKSSEGSRRQREESELRQAFKVFDIDGDGLIDAHELKQTMREPRRERHRQGRPSHDQIG